MNLVNFKICQWLGATIDHMQKDIFYLPALYGLLLSNLKYSGLLVDLEIWVSRSQRFPEFGYDYEFVINFCRNVLLDLYSNKQPKCQFHALIEYSRVAH